MTPAVRILNLSKRYAKGGGRVDYKMLRDTISGIAQAPGQWFRSKWGAKEKPAGGRDFWALKDLSLEIAEGEVVGMIGGNGAGKSTLLKILSRITEPTGGCVELRGSVGSLLEVGTGFHRELTGRENIYLNGAILGMKKAEITRRFDEIVEFSGVEAFLDNPVKHYSSGMYMRLAFAVAAHLEPNILLIDEVLAVGDAPFRKKCLGKIGDISKSGRTVIFVSHDLDAVSTLTNTAILLDKGRCLFYGKTAEAISRYRLLCSQAAEGQYSAPLDPDLPAGIVGTRVLTSDPGYTHRGGEPLTLEFQIEFRQKLYAPALYVQLVNAADVAVVGFRIAEPDTAWARLGRVQLRCAMPAPRLEAGDYTVRAWLTHPEGALTFIEGVCRFEVLSREIHFSHPWFPREVYLEDGAWSVQ